MLLDLAQTPQRAIIIAGGDATRWDNHLGIKKHFIEIDGEQIIKRTVRLLKENGIDDIWIVSKDDDDYVLKDTRQYVPEFKPHNDGVDKFLNSQSLWLKEGRTIVLYGDCYFTDEAMDIIANHAHKDWQLFGRAFGSRITGCPWGECFAQSFFETHIPEHLRNLEKAVGLWHQKKIARPSGWQHYRFMIGLPLEMVDTIMAGDRFVNIDDFTDDFDTKEDYELWIEKWNNR